MSRICVKNLPKHVAEDRLRDFFSRKGEVTDAKLMRTNDGKSRQFGFVGFRSEIEAEEAIKFFHNSFMDTCRITCELARKIGDPEIPRPWSRYSSKKQDKLNEKKDVADFKHSSHTASAAGENKHIENDDPQFQEFIQVMQHRAKSKLWANDTLEASPSKQNGDTSKKKVKVRKEGKSEMFPVVDKLDDTDEETNEMLDSQIAEKARTLIHDKNSNEEENGNGDLKKGNGDTDVQKDEREVLDASRLFVRNLPYAATEDELEEHFSKFGSVSQVHLVTDKETKRSKGIGYVLFKHPESAARALEELDSSSFQGRLLHVMPAKQKHPSPNQEINGSSNHSKTFKQNREEQRKASEVSGNARAWNSLFMSLNTVAENMARKFGVSKGDLLNQEAVAVQLALGETQVIAETKKALANAGVNVTSLEKLDGGKNEGVKRSNHVILVKNLPYGSSESELASMFGKYGSLDKVILPPTKTLGLVVFLEPAEARAAFRGLVYKRYKDVPLYLEWAPADILCQKPMPVGDSNKTSVVGENDAKRALLEQQVGGVEDAEIDPERVESRSLFVKNLNFRTSDESLLKHFSENMKEGKVLSVRIKKHLKNGKNVSMGFGFVEFDSVDTATKLCRDLQGTVLDGHALILQLCHARDGKVAKKVDKDQSSTKLIVRNVAFEATAKELRQLFNSFGQIKRLRLPMRFGKHRGFAFVEFTTQQEAQNALQALSSTHLYGRHLVMERAKAGESLEELRARTAANFTDIQVGTLNQNKLNKKRKQAELDDGNFMFD